MRHVWFNCGVGVAGDMMLAALVDAGADGEEVAASLAGLNVDGYSLSFEPVHRGSVAATYANVAVDRHEPSDHRHGHHEHGDGHHPHRPVRDILRLLQDAELPDRVRERATRVFQTLGQAEGEVHDIDPADVELHEVGSTDAIIDVVGVCAALESLDVDRISCSPIGVGHGSATTAHGLLTTPAPAVARMLAAHRIDVVGIDTDLEIATPTGVALLAALADHVGAPPTMTVERTGFGAGTANPSHRPNVVNVLVGTSAPAASTRQALVLVETNVDDVSGEVLGHTVAALLDAGASDAWITPIVMKKGRPAYTVHALTSAAAAESLMNVLLRETGSLGARFVPVERFALNREELCVDVGGHPVRVKRAAGRWKVEFDDAETAAAALDRPVREVLRDAEATAANETLQYSAKTPKEI